MNAAVSTPANHREAPGPFAGESTTPLLVNVDGMHNVTDLLVARCAAAPHHIAFETRTPGAPLTDPWNQISTREFMNDVHALARGLIATDVRSGDRVMIVAPTQYLWAVADHAALFVGAVVVPLYDTAPSSQAQAVIADAQPVAAFAGDPKIAERLAAAASAADLAAPMPIWTFSEEWPNGGMELSPDSSSIAELALKGEHIDGATLEQRRLQAGLDDIATIVYTSGTTGAPKGALITHRNLLGQVLNTAAAYREVVHEDGNTILFLPLTHVLGRALQLICVANGMRVAHLADPKEVVAALPALRPTFLVVVPRVLEKIQTAAAEAAQRKRITPLWRAAVRTAQQWTMHLEDQQHDPTARPGNGLRLRHALFDRLFYRRLRGVMGGRVDYLLSGAATLRPELARFFRGVGVPVIEGYGLTETTAPLTGGRPGSLAAGSVGRPLPGNTVRIAANGEVLARGIGVFAGYRDPAHMAEAFDGDFFRTGDLGSLDATGALSLHGRLKHVIVTSTGRTISPENWEDALEQHPRVAYAALVGTDRPYLTGVLIIEDESADVASAYAPEGWRVYTDTALRDELAAAISSANEARSPAEQVQYWRAVTLQPSRTHEFVTPTMKLKRNALLNALAPLIDDLYPSR